MCSVSRRETQKQTFNSLFFFFSPFPGTSECLLFWRSPEEPRASSSPPKQLFCVFKCSPTPPHPRHHPYIWYAIIIKQGWIYTAAQIGSVTSSRRSKGDRIPSHPDQASFICGEKLDVSRTCSRMFPGFSFASQACFTRSVSWRYLTIYNIPVSRCRREMRPGGEIGSPNDFTSSGLAVMTFFIGFLKNWRELVTKTADWTVSASVPWRRFEKEMKHWGTLFKRI